MIDWAQLDFIRQKKNCSQASVHKIQNTVTIGFCVASALVRISNNTWNRTSVEGLQELGLYHKLVMFFIKA